MKNALLLFSNQSGHGQFAAHEDAIVSALHRTFDEVDVVFTASAEEGQKRAKEACGEYHSLIIVGGDGTFHNILNAVAEEKDIPIIGYINNGTIGDIGRNFGVTGSYKKALKIIAGQHVMKADICKTGDRYFAYVAAVGSFADIAYKAPRNRKQRLGKIAYYNMAVEQAFKKSKLNTTVYVDGVLYKKEVPFLMALNGRNIGGFAINKMGSMFDGKMELFLSNPGPFNGLLPYFFRRKKVVCLQGEHFHIKTDSDMAWCLDGEKGPVGELDIILKKGLIRVYVDPKIRKKM